MVHNYKHNLLIIIILSDSCRRTKVRPYGLDAIGMFDDYAVGGQWQMGPETAPLLCKYRNRVVGCVRVLKDCV